MLDVDITVTLENAGTFTARPDARDVRRWEGVTGKSWLQLGEPTLTDLTRLVFFTAIRSGSFSGTWDDFDNACISIDLGADLPKAEPTPREPSPDSSSN